MGVFRASTIVPPWAHIHFLEALPFSTLQSPEKLEKPVWFCFPLIFYYYFFSLCTGASAAVPLLCFAVVKHGTVLISGADVNPANLERVKPAPQSCGESVAATPALQPPPPPQHPHREEKHSSNSALQTIANFSGKVVANDGPKITRAWLTTFLRTADFQTIQAEVGMKVLAAPWVEGFPRGTLFPRWVPGSNTPQGCHTKHSWLHRLFHKADANYKPHISQIRCKGGCCAIPSRPSSPHSHLQGSAHFGVHRAGGRGWGAF